MDAHIELIDTRAGHYYVSVVDGPRKALLAGPWPTHRQALQMVETVSWKIIDKYPEAHWYGFGTARIADDYAGEIPHGSQNHLFGLPV